MTEGVIEFDAPAPNGGTVRKSGRVIESLPSGMVKVEIMVGGEPTTMIINPNGSGSNGAKKPKREKKPKEVDASQLNLFDQLKEEIRELKALVSPAPDDALEGLEINNDTILRPEYLHPDVEGILGGPLPDHRVFARPHIRGDRHYMYGRPNPDPKSARQWLIFPPLPGVTSIIKKTCPTPPNLVKWKATFPGGLDAANEYTELAAARGTIMHSIFADLVNGIVPAMGETEWHRYLEIKIRKQKVDDSKWHHEWDWFMRKAILSFLQWIEDYEVTFILMEIALVSETLGYAGQIDVFCEMNDRIYTKPVLEVVPAKRAKAAKPTRVTKANNSMTERHWEVAPPYKVLELSDHSFKAKPCKDDMEFSRREPEMENILDRRIFNPRKRIKAFVDFKSGEHSYETHAHQLGFYVPLFRESFPNCDISGARVFNWHPTDWNETKANFSYKFIDQSMKLSQRRTECLLELYNLDAREDIPNVLQITGTPTIGTKPQELVASKPFTEHWEETFHLAMDLGLDL